MSRLRQVAKIAGMGAVIAALRVITMVHASPVEATYSLDLEGRSTGPLSPVHILPSDPLRLPTRLTVSGDELIVLDRYRDEAVLALDRSTGEVRRSFGRHGKGPAELFGPFAIVVDSATVVVLDVSMNRLTHLGTADGGNEFRLTDLSVLSVDVPIISAAAMEGGRLLVIGLSPDNGLLVLDSSGRVDRESSPREAVAVSPSRLIESRQGVLRGTDDYQRFVRTRRFASRLDILDSEGLKVVVAWGPDRFDSARQGREVRFGYLDAAVTSSGFLALYSGRTRSGFPGIANYGSQVHEFDWTGRLIAVHDLDSDVIAITWSESDGLLYAIRHDPLPEILIYSLP